MKRLIEAINLNALQLLAASFIVCMVVMSIILMVTITDIRLRELKSSLQNMTNERSTGASLSLIARYNFIQHRYAKGTEKSEDYLTEGELMTAISASTSTTLGNHEKIGRLEQLVIAIMNFTGRWTNSAPIENIAEDQGQKILEVAFFYERRREFGKAIGAYNASLENYARRRDMLAYIFLHRGFCNSNIGKRTEALADYQRVKAYDVVGGDLSVTADVLALFLLDLDKRLALVERMIDSVEKGELLYLLMAYPRAVDSLNVAIARKPEPKAFFFRGRAHEEIGGIPNAIADYRKAIALDRGGEWGRKANRRLYILGTFYESDASVTDEAKLVASQNSDSGFIEDYKTFEKSVDGANIARLGDTKLIQETLKVIEERKDTDLSRINLVKPDGSGDRALATAAAGDKQSILDRMIATARVKQRAGTLRRLLLSDKTSRQLRKQLLLKNYPMLTKININDSNEFFGIIDTEDEKTVELITVMGLVKLPKNVILRRTEIASDQALE
jgi:tetratricopeptide (TPR) repeat protein